MKGAQPDVAWVDGPEPPKKGRLFGKSCTSDFVRSIVGNTLLNKVLSYYLELSFVDSAFINGNPKSVIPVT